MGGREAVGCLALCFLWRQHPGAVPVSKLIVSDPLMVRLLMVTVMVYGFEPPRMTLIPPTIEGLNNSLGLALDKGKAGTRGIGKVSHTDKLPSVYFTFTRQLGRKRPMCPRGRRA